MTYCLLGAINTSTSWWRIALHGGTPKVCSSNLAALYLFHWGLDNFQNKHVPFPESTLVQSLSFCNLWAWISSFEPQLGALFWDTQHQTSNPCEGKVGKFWAWVQWVPEIVATWRVRFQSLLQWGNMCFPNYCSWQSCLTSLTIMVASWLVACLNITILLLPYDLNNSIHHKQPSQISTKNKNFWMFCLMFLQQKVQRFD